MTIEKLVDSYNAARAAYYSGESIMSDASFDALEQRLAQQFPGILKNVGYVERAGKVDLPVFMGSLDQLHDQESYLRWISKYPESELAVNTEKIDGNSNLLKYVDGVLQSSYSRGNGLRGANNIRHTANIVNIPKVIANGFTGEIRGEIVISKEYWPIVKKLIESSKVDRDFKNARNFVAGFMNAHKNDLGLYRYVTFIAFEVYGLDVNKTEMLEWLKSNKFQIPSYSITELADMSYDKYQKLIDRVISMSAYECDGVVVELNSKVYREQITDPSDLNPSHAKKIKLPSKSVTTTVTEVEWNASKDGLLKPVIHFDPVEITGVTISKASGYNAKNIFDNGIGIGAVVAITRQGDVIPRVDAVIVRADTYMPPNDGWNETKVDLLATDADEEIIQKKLEHFFSKIEIDFISEGNVSKLIEAGVTSPMQFIKNPSILETVIGENGRKAAKQWETVSNGNITEANLFAALGIFGRGMGERKLTALFAVHSLQDIILGSVTELDICKIEGFEQKSASLIMNNLENAKDIYNQLQGYVTFSQKQVQKTAYTGKFSGQTFCCTGVRFTDDVKNKIEQAGGVVTDSWSSSVTTLVAKDPESGSGKVKKAKDKKIPVISLQSLISIL